MFDLVGDEIMFQGRAVARLLPDLWPSLIEDISRSLRRHAGNATWEDGYDEAYDAVYAEGHSDVCLEACDDQGPCKECC